jgi:putative membrane protein
MKAILRAVLINLLVIYLVDAVYPGFSILHDIKTLITAAVIWLLLNKIVKPIIKLLLLPINLITLNLFSWVIGLITLFLLPLIVNGISIAPYDFLGVNYQGFSVPPFHLNMFLSFVVASSFLNLFHNIITWIIKKDSN